MYKLIALDMDGTLLNSDKQISEPTKKSIALARDKGVKVVLASGRPIDGMVDKLQELNISGDEEFVLYYNGSMVQELGNEEIIHRNIINARSAKEVAKLTKEFGLDVHAFSEEHGLITPKTSQYTQLEATINGLTITEMDFDLLEDDHPIIKAMIVGEPDKLSSAIQALAPEYHERYTIVQSAPFFLEFLSLKSNKGIGVEAIAKHLDILPSEVICVGDAENDNHMIKYAGLGVAMGNAMEETKALADYIAPSNDEHGVAAVIDKFILA
ncbi:Cof-type HAD-IIB family hydrolase [Vibrio sp. 10N.261.55.A7]|uniref:Cof-type HAD-IIB family hydrolase n=1 Tax=Vibrio sp. 10N.261.55.A7 TaxID=1880851 RepID=UPI000C82C16C|nr:Cof-type HAD-IIB family hydrolase [Vibrio sp. 10N.261.55.A7]PMJ92409.1 HAD family hydrolase [Vibrio sp. 10N.261.55.A7]